MNDEYYGWMGINEGWFSDALKNYKNIETLKKQWKAAADKFVSHHHIQRFITPQQEEMCKKYYNILKREDVSYAEYKKAFNFMCKFMGLGNKDLIIEHIEFENDSRDKEKRVIKLSYSRGRIEIEIPEGVSLIHISPIKGITALEPSFRNKKFGSFMYPSKRVFFTLSKDIPKSKASLSDATIHRYVARDRIKKAFIDPSCNSFGMRAVYVETDKPIAVESYHTFLERILNKVGQFFTFSGHKSKHEQAYIEMCEQPVLFKESEDLLALQASKEYIRKIWPEIERILDACKLKYPDLSTLFYICSTSDIESSLLDYGIECRSIPIIFFNKNALMTKFSDNLNPVYYGKEPFDIPKPHDEIVTHGNAFIKEFTTTIERLGYGLIVYNHKLYAADAIYFMPYGPKFKAFIKDYLKQQITPQLIIREQTIDESLSIDGVYDSFLEDCIDLEAIDEFSLSELWDHLNNWQTHNQNQSKQEFISNHVSKKDFEEIKDCIEHLKKEDDYHEYKKYFNRLCSLCHIAPTGTVIYSYIYAANESDPESNFVRIVYTYNIKKIDMPEDAMFYHMTKVKHLHELKPTFRSKSFTKLGGNRQYFYSSPRVYLTLNKTMLKWFADYSFSDEVETYVVDDKTIKQAYVDPLVPGSISRAIYIETDKPIKVITLEEWQKREALRGVKFQRKNDEDKKREHTKHAHEALIDFALDNAIAPILEHSIEDYIDNDIDVYGDMVTRQQVHIIQNLNDVIRYDTSSNKPEEIDEKIDLIKKIYSSEIAYLWRCIFNLQVRSKLFSRFMSFFVIPRIGLFNSDERIIVDKFLEFTKAIDRVALAVDLYECGDIEEWQLSKTMHDMTYIIDTVSQDVILYDEQIKDEIIQTCIEEHVNSYNIKNN